jgi:replicative DNA helicase
MTPEQALQILSEATSQLKCTRKEHEVIIAAISALKEVIKESETK